MKARRSTLAALLVAAAASVAIAAAPAAFAEPDCVSTGEGGGFQGGTTTDCSSPGNNQIDATPPAYAQPWQGGMFPWDMGMYVL